MVRPLNLDHHHLAVSKPGPMDLAQGGRSQGPFLEILEHFVERGTELQRRWSLMLVWRSWPL